MAAPLLAPEALSTLAAAMAGSGAGNPGGGGASARSAVAAAFLTEDTQPAAQTSRSDATTGSDVVRALRVAAAERVRGFVPSAAAHAPMGASYATNP